MFLSRLGHARIGPGQSTHANTAESCTMAFLTGTDEYSEEIFRLIKEHKLLQDCLGDFICAMESGPHGVGSLYKVFKKASRLMRKVDRADD